MKIPKNGKSTSDSSLPSDYPAAAGQLKELSMNSVSCGCEGHRSLLSIVLFSLNHFVQQTLCEALQMLSKV